MPFRRFATHHPFATLGFVVVAWLFVPVGLKSFTRASFFELTAPVTVAADYARGLQEYWSLRLHSNHELIVAGRDLARINASYEFAVQQNAEPAGLERLESLLRLPTYNNYRLEHARVARRDFPVGGNASSCAKGKTSASPLARLSCSAAESSVA